VKDKTKLPHPIQPLAYDEDNVIRFKSNEVVLYLLDNGSFDMNHLALQNFSQEDREQFAQLIGYSFSGWCDLSYVRNETYTKAEQLYEQIINEGKKKDDIKATSKGKLNMKCAAHPKYEAKREPIANCKKCRNIYKTKNKGKKQ
jgi:hypothetical protein